VTVVETAGNKPHAVIARLKSHGITVIHKCTSVRHAVSAEKAGADVISIDGFEAAGHPGEDDVPGLVLIPAVRRQINVPILASGGIADGKGMAAALVLGADGVNVGTRFMLTRESGIHENIKRALVAASERDTTLIKRTLKRTARFYSNAVSEQIVALERRPQGATYEDLAALMAGSRGSAALAGGDVHGGLICASQVIGLIDDIPSCAELIPRMVAECRASLAAALDTFGMH
jgi:nitronate monooxygenase